MGICSLYTYAYDDDTAVNFSDIQTHYTCLNCNDLEIEDCDEFDFHRYAVEVNAPCLL